MHQWRHGGGVAISITESGEAVWQRRNGISAWRRSIKQRGEISKGSVAAKRSISSENNLSVIVAK